MYNTIGSDNLMTWDFLVFVGENQGLPQICRKSIVYCGKGYRVLSMIETSLDFLRSRT